MSVPASLLSAFQTWSASTHPAPSSAQVCAVLNKMCRFSGNKCLSLIHLFTEFAPPHLSASAITAAVMAVLAGMAIMALIVICYGR